MSLRCMQRTIASLSHKAVNIKEVMVLSRLALFDKEDVLLVAVYRTRKIVGDLSCLVISRFLVTL